MYKHPTPSSCVNSQIAWSGSSVALSDIALLLDVFKGSMKLNAAADALEPKPAVISALSTAASICQIKSEDELSPTMVALHFIGCGAGALVVVGILLRKSNDNFAISLPTRLVSVAALLRHYSPSPHPLLRLLSHVPTLAYSNQSACRMKLTTLYNYI
jgi:hypothetical protein